MMFRGKKNYDHLEIDDAVLTASEKDVAHMEFRLNKKWLGLVFVLMAFVLCGLGARVVYLAGINGTSYQDRASANSMRYNVVPAPRGLILDRYGVPLVENVPETDVVLLLSLMPEDAVAYARMLEILRHALAMSVEDINSAIEETRAQYRAGVVLATRISQDALFTLIENETQLPGVRLVTTARRHYIDSTIFSHILGYTGIVYAEDLEKDDSYYLTDHIGRIGVEKVYEQLLRGQHGATGAEVDARGNARRIAQSITPVPGHDLYLTIDAELQKQIAAVMEEKFVQYGLSRGAAVALDPRDGSVRALVSLPAYDNNAFVGGISQAEYTGLLQQSDRPLLNRAIGGAYPPGSTVKPMLAAGALAEGVVDEHTTVNSTGAIRVGAYTFRDWRVNGVADVRRAIAVSHDIFFYAIGGGYGNIAGMGMDTMKKYYNLFGFGEYTGIDLTGEVNGLIPSPAWKQERFDERWSIGNDYHASIGQGYVTATPLQIANATAAVANGGTLWQPHLLAYWRDQGGALTSFQPQKIRENIMTPQIAHIVREGMRQTVTEGTGTILNGISLAFCLDTLTVRFLCLALEQKVIALRLLFCLQFLLDAL
jgi:penicillin-binding protein 2